jgi:Ca2+-binding RTX toxin-like protein
MAEINGTASNDTLNGTSGDDLITGGAGNDTLEGSGGNDTSVFSGAMADYRLGWDSKGYLSVTDLNTADGDDGVDLLRDIETMQFADGNLRVRAGGEVRVNTTTANVQNSSGVTALNDGGWAMPKTSSPTSPVMPTCSTSRRSRVLAWFRRARSLGVSSSGANRTAMT